MTNKETSHKIYSISEVATITGIKPHLLRQWESYFPQLKPRRLPSGKRAYTEKEIRIVRRIKTLLQHEGMTVKGARLRLAQEIGETTAPKDITEMRFLVDKIADEARSILAIYDTDDVSDEETENSSQ